MDDDDGCGDRRDSSPKPSMDRKFVTTDKGSRCRLEGSVVDVVVDSCWHVSIEPEDGLSAGGLLEQPVGSIDTGVASFVSKDLGGGGIVSATGERECLKEGVELGVVGCSGVSGEVSVDIMARPCVEESQFGGHERKWRRRGRRGGGCGSFNTPPSLGVSKRSVCKRIGW